MNTTVRRRGAVYAIPLVIALAMAQRAAPHVRTVDFIVVFASGVLFGVTLTGLVQFLKRESRVSR